jgi:uncharacterized membrane protein
MNLAVLIAALGATTMELAEAAVVVLVVISRGHRRPALVGVVSAAVVVAVTAFIVGPRVVGLVPLDRLRQLLGGGLLLLGSWWLLQAVLRPSVVQDELDEETGAASRWALRGPVGAALISAKAVGVEGAEAAVLVMAIGAPHHAEGAAGTGAGIAAAVVVLLAAFLERRLTSLTSYTLNRVAGTALALVGCFWLTEGSHLPTLAAVAVFVLPVTLATAAWVRWRWRPESVAAG